MINNKHKRTLKRNYKLKRGGSFTKIILKVASRFGLGPKYVEPPLEKNPLLSELNPESVSRAVFYYNRNPKRRSYRNRAAAWVPKKRRPIIAY
jgi:hypothetical protein